MEVDDSTCPPSLSSALASTLKRSNSAPMINVPISPIPIANTLRSEELLIQPIPIRSRRFSANFSSHPIAGLRVAADRVNQLKQEESVDLVNQREAANERQVHDVITMSQSWEDLTLTDANTCVNSGFQPRTQRSASTSGFTEPLHLNMPSLYAIGGCSSPTRIGKQCFSPSMQQPVRNSTLCTSPLPSPTRHRTISRRSLSPVSVSLRPSHFPVKRKSEAEMDMFSSPPKRAASFSVANRSSTPDRMLMFPHHLLHNTATNLSRTMSGSLDDQQSNCSPNPDHTVPVDIPAIGTPESVCSTDSIGWNFRPMDQDSAPPTPTSTA